MIKLLSYKVLKVKILEKAKIGLESLYLVERRHLKMKTIDYLVCKNYSKRTNTYDDGYSFEDPRVAYEYFNACLKNGDIIEVEKKEIKEGEDNVVTSAFS